MMGAGKIIAENIQVVLTNCRLDRCKLVSEQHTFAEHGSAGHHLAIKLLDIIRLTEPRGLVPGATLNAIAPRFGVPNGWTFPWTKPFGGSIEYGDLRLGLVVRNRDVIVCDFSIVLWDLNSADDGELYRAPKSKPNFKRNSRIDLQGIYSGMPPDELRLWLRGQDLRYSEFERPSLVSEEGRQIIANDNTLFSFCRGHGTPWLMDVVIFHHSHRLWPIKNGVGEVRSAARRIPTL